MAVFSLGDISAKAFLNQSQIQTLRPVIHMGSWSAHSSQGHATSRSGGARKGAQLEDNEEQFADWAEHWPFPEFQEPNNKRSRGGSATGKKGMGKTSSVSEPYFSAEAFDSPESPSKKKAAKNFSDLASDSSDDMTFVKLVQPHPLSSDWNLQYVPRKRGVSNADLSGGVVTAEKEPSASSRPTSPGTAHLRSPNKSSSVGPTITKDELTALMASFDPTAAVGNGDLPLGHTDLGWIVRRDHLGRITLPSVHLNLGNIVAALESGNVRERQILINSPRSGIIMIRHGISLKELIRDPGVVQLQDGSSGSRHLTWIERKKIANERVRALKVEHLMNEYREVCHNVSTDDILTFCKKYDPRHPSTALTLELGRHVKSRNSRSRPSSSISRPSVTVTTQTQHLTESLLQREDRLRRARTNRLILDTDTREKNVEKIKVKEERSSTVLAHREAQRELVKNRHQSRTELWNTQHTSHERVARFRNLILAQRTLRRLDEVTCHLKEGKRAAIAFQDVARRTKASDDQQKVAESEQFLSQARKRFLENQL
jgi:hypothetical protein